MHIPRVLKYTFPLLSYARVAVADLYFGQVAIPLDGASSDLDDVRALATNTTAENAGKNVKDIVEGLDEIAGNLKRVADIWSEELSYCDTTSLSTPFRQYQFAAAETKTPLPPFDDNTQAALFTHWQKASYLSTILFVGGANTALASVDAISKIISGVDIQTCKPARRVLAGIKSSESYVAYELERKILPNFAKEIESDRRGIAWLVGTVLRDVKCSTSTSSESKSMEIQD